MFMYCVFSIDEFCVCFEVDWVLVGVVLFVIFDEEVVLIFVWLGWIVEFNFGVFLFEVMWIDCDRVDELVMIIVVRLLLDLFEWSL